MPAGRSLKEDGVGCYCSGLKVRQSNGTQMNVNRQPESCRSLLGRNKFIYFVRGSSGGINQAPVMLWGSPGATRLEFSFNFKYPDAFWTLGSKQTIFGDPGTKEMWIV